MSKSVPIDLIEKPFDSKKQREWVGTYNYIFIFTELYINKKFGKDIHFFTANI